MGKRKTSKQTKSPDISGNSADRGGLEIRTQRFEGPIPPPLVLREYNDIVPGAAERILAMAELQGKHRRDLESKVIEGDSSRASRGQVFAFIFTLVLIIGGFSIIWQGKSLEGIATIIGSITALAGIFITGKIIKNKNLQNRHK